MQIRNPYSVSITNPFSLLGGLSYALFFSTAAFVVGPLTSKSDYATSFLIWAPFFVVGPLLAWLIKSLAYRYGLWSARQNVVSLVQSILDSSEDYGDFVLYLRPHWLDGNPMYRNPYFSQELFRPGFWLHINPISLDHFFSLVLKTTVVALGTSEMRISTGSVQVPDSDWKKVAATLIKNASAILYVPGSTNGLVWELDEILRAGVQNRVIILQPPEKETANVRDNTVGKISGQAGGESVKKYWDRVTEELKEVVAIGLSDFNQRGKAYPLITPCSASLEALVEKLEDAFFDRKSRTI